MKNLNTMKTRFVVLITAVASFALFTLFAYCTKEDTNPAILDLQGTTWKTTKTVQVNGTEFYGLEERMFFADFTTEGTGKYRWPDCHVYSAGDASFTYFLNGDRGAIFANGHIGSALAWVNDNVSILVIDTTHISIGGIVFTKQ